MDKAIVLIQNHVQRSSSFSNNFTQLSDCIPDDGLTRPPSKFKQRNMLTSHTIPFPYPSDDVFRTWENLDTHFVSERTDRPMISENKDMCNVDHKNYSLSTLHSIRRFSFGNLQHQRIQLQIRITRPTK